jgi:hypothetical protein
MKSYEILPAGMTGSGASVPKSYEILPGAGTAAQGLGGEARGSGCGGSCSSEKVVGPVGMVAPSSTLPPAGIDLDVIFQSIVRLGPGGGGPGPGTSLCSSIRDRIRWLEREIDQRMEQLGPRGPEIAAAWRLARQVCSAPDAQSLCARLVEQQHAVGMQMRPGNLGDLDAYNVAWGAALNCSNNEIGLAFEGRRFWGCMAAISSVQRLERRAADEMKMSPGVSYLQDIEPMERELVAARVQLAQCERTVPGPIEPSDRLCNHVGGSGCVNGRTMRCDYNCPGGGSCSKTVACSSPTDSCSGTAYCPDR